MKHLPDHIRKSSVWMNRIAMVGLAFAMSALAVLSVKIYDEYNRWEPLGPYPVQVLLSPSGESLLSEVPTYYWNDKITVRGTKHYKEDVIVTGGLTWVSDDPPGYIVPIVPREQPAGVLRHEDETVQATYRNEIPDQILAKLRQMSAEGIEKSSWHLAGTEWPTNPKTGEKGESLTWITPTFTIIHKDRPA